MITEIGGTVGDIESLPFLEAIRQLQTELGRDRCIFVHLTLVPCIGHAGELKTKPTQHSVNELRRIGIQPDMVVCRSEEALSREIRAEDRAVREPAGRGRDLGARRRRHLQGAADVPGRGRRRPDPRPLRDRGAGSRARATGRRWCAAPATRRSTVRIALVGKYVQLADAYLSVVEALRHAGFHNGAKIDVFWVDSESLDDEEGRELLAAGRRHPDPRRLRRARHRGQDQRGARRARARDPVPRHLPRHAARGRRLRAPRGRAWRAPTRPSSIPRRRSP